ncbi:hypothetical protein [Nonomuraea sp. NPDC049480]|uniref:hypothetical protein n=1 Tax=Nonomuraea sp. NPDC049480 TaxID=3364353 RepID=UPI0037A36C4E
MAGWWWRRGQPRIALFVAITMMGGSLLNTMAKLMFNRARPRLPDPMALTSGLSFPGHAQAAVVNCSVVLIVFWQLLHAAGRRTFSNCRLCPSGSFSARHSWTLEANQQDASSL